MSYAVLVNGGRVMEPRIVRHVIDNDGNIVFTPEPTLVRQIDISEATRQSLLTDLNQVVTRGTATTTFSGFGDGLDNVGGKTGTGQSTKTADNHAWFVGVTRINNPKYVVAVVIDQGGSGGQIAAPVARHIMQYLMGNEPTPIVEGQEAQ
jgi:penicillin-binding protein 2